MSQGLRALPALLEVLVSISALTWQLTTTGSSLLGAPISSSVFCALAAFDIQIYVLAKHA